MAYSRKAIRRERALRRRLRRSKLYRWLYPLLWWGEALGVLTIHDLPKQRVRRARQRALLRRVILVLFILAAAWTLGDMVRRWMEAGDRWPTWAEEHA